MVHPPGSRGASHGSAPFRHLAGTVLLVDDDADLLEGLGRGLRHSDYRVLLAGSGAAALAVLGREPVDVIVSDLEMPGMGGLEVLDRARALNPRAIRIVLTGHASAESAIEAINEEEVFRYLTKPMTRDHLASTLHAAFQRLSEAREREERAPAVRPPINVVAVISGPEREALREACGGFPTVDAEPPGPPLPPRRR